MKISLGKKSNVTIGLFMAIIGFAAMGLSVYIFSKPEQKIDISQEMNKEVSACMQEAQKLKFLVISSPSQITIKSNYSNNDKIFAERELYKSSLLIEKCENLELVNFCAGEGCVDSKLVYFQLKYPLEKVKAEYESK